MNSIDMMTKRGLIVWAITLAILAGLDIITTHYSLSVGGIEINPFLRSVSLHTLILIKIVGTGLIIGLCLHFKSVVGLALAVGMNLICVSANISAILLLH